MVTFLVADKDNPGSICSSLHSARENARTLREILPTEAWELLNEFISECTRNVDGAINKRTRFEFLKRIVITLQTIAGMLDGTMNRNDAYTFSHAGPQSRARRHDQPHRRRALRAAAAGGDAGAAPVRGGAVDERAQEPVRLPDVPPAHAHPREAHRRAPVPAARRPVPALLPVLPHRRSSTRSIGCRAAKSVLEVLADAARFIERAPLATLDQPGLHELIDKLQLHISNVHDMIAGIYFPSRVADMRHMPSQAQSRASRRPSARVHCRSASRPRPDGQRRRLHLRDGA